MCIFLSVFFIQHIPKIRKHLWSNEQFLNAICKLFKKGKWRSTRGVLLEVLLCGPEWSESKLQTCTMVLTFELRTFVKEWQPLVSLLSVQ